jgi:hypothetical protein
MLKIILGYLHLIFFKMQDAFMFTPAAMAHILNPSLVYKVPRQPRAIKQRNPVSKNQKKLLMTGASFYLQDRGTLTCEWLKWLAG